MKTKFEALHDAQQGELPQQFQLDGQTQHLYLRFKKPLRKSAPWDVLACCMHAQNERSRPVEIRNSTNEAEFAKNREHLWELGGIGWAHRGWVLITDRDSSRFRRVEIPFTRRV